MARSKPTWHWAKLEATPFGEQHHTMPAMGNDPSDCADTAKFASQSVGSLQDWIGCTEVNEHL